ncbi:MAG: hypothetical protein AB1649_28390, partial [Chloroflexota bacterium]
MMGPTMRDYMLDTLENLIAPGKRVRLSPFVESAQFSVLTGEIPDEKRRAESSRSILGRNKQRIDQIARQWVEFTREGKDFAANDYTQPDFLDAYLAYYFSVNVPKIQLVLLDLVRDQQLNGVIKLLDIGVGTGTTAIATLDFLLVLGHVCDLYGQPFPVTDLQVIGLDRSEGSIGHARRMVNAYAESLDKRLKERNGTESGQSEGNKARLNPHPDIMQCVHAWASAATWYRHDLKDCPPDPEFKPNLVVVANVLNEMPDRGKENLEVFLDRLPQNTIVITIEPGTEHAAASLMAWRKNFMSRNSGFISLAPCGQEFGNRLPEGCERCWNLRRESFHQPSLYKAFREACNKFFRNERSLEGYDPYENKLLSWSYVVLGKLPPSTPSGCGAGRSLRHREIITEEISLRYIGSYRNKHGESEPVSHGPDDFEAQKLEGAWKEYLKVCPAPFVDVSKIALERSPGFQTPPLRYGAKFTASNVQVQRLGEGIYKFVPQGGDCTEISTQPPVALESSFLPEYDATVRRAIDELAHRLFGFANMWDLQHEMLSRALTGKRLLGIAATGGGKS